MEIGTGIINNKRFVVHNRGGFYGRGGFRSHSRSHSRGGYTLMTLSFFPTWVYAPPCVLFYIVYIEKREKPYKIRDIIWF